jgi:hypothetical protein
MRDLLNFRPRRAARALCGAILLAAFAPGVASAGDRAGALQCRLSGNNITILMENQTLDCVFQDDDEGAQPVHYIGKLTKVGANITVNGPGEIVWLVGAATGHVGPGALAGAYGGPNTSLKVGVGGGGALLVGGSDNTISLQPLSLEGGSGLGFTAGIESLILTYVPDQPPPPYRRRHLITK